MSSMESIQRSRRSADLYEVDDIPSPPAPDVPSSFAPRDASDLDHPIAYPNELFIPLAAPTPRVRHEVAPQSKPFVGSSVAERAPIKITPPPAGPVYTQNANEVTTYSTHGAGARTLAAQFMVETATGKNCFNWNIGNMKGTANGPHMYLRGVWEVKTPSESAQLVAEGKGLAHIATAKEIADNKWAVPVGMAIVVFNPPHEAARFRSFRSFEEGAAAWLAKHQTLATADPAYLASLNKGDPSAVAHALERSGYYTMSEADYAKAMAAHKAVLDAPPGMP